MAIELTTCEEVTQHTVLTLRPYASIPESPLVPADTQEFEHDGLFFAYSPLTGRLFTLTTSSSLGTEPAWVLLDLWRSNGKEFGFRLYGKYTPRSPKPPMVCLTRLIGQYFLNWGNPLPKGVWVRHYTKQGDPAFRNRLSNLRLYESRSTVPITDEDLEWLKQQINLMEGE